MRGMATNGASSSRRKSCRCKRPICDGRMPVQSMTRKRTTVFTPKHQTRQHFGDVEATAAAPGVARIAQNWSTRPRPGALEHLHQVRQDVPPIYGCRPRRANDSRQWRTWSLSAAGWGGISMVRR